MKVLEVKNETTKDVTVLWVNMESGEFAWIDNGSSYIFHYTNREGPYRFVPGERVKLGNWIDQWIVHSVLMFDTDDLDEYLEQLKAIEVAKVKTDNQIIVHRVKRAAECLNIKLKKNFEMDLDFFTNPSLGRSMTEWASAKKSYKLEDIGDDIRVSLSFTIPKEK